MSDQSPNSTPAIRHDGWTPERRTRFLEHLAAYGNVRAACAHAGKSAEAAYRLKRREAAFARAWEAALALARVVSQEVLATRAIDGVEEDVWYRGEVVGTRRKYDTRLLLAHLARLDKQAEESGAADDLGRFDELVALAAGAEVPESLGYSGDILPPTREEAIDIAGQLAVEEYEDELAASADETDEEGEAPDPAVRLEAILEVRRAAEQAAAAEWDAWHGTALALVDGLRGADPGDADVAPCTPSVSSTSAITSGLLRANAAQYTARA